MQVQMTAVQYNDPFGYFFSSSQSDTFEKCKKQWEFDKLSYTPSHDLEFFPFEYGGYVHDMLEYSMEESVQKLRVQRLYDYIAEHPRTPKISQQLGKYSVLDHAENNLIPRFTNLQGVTKSCEIELGVRAPDNWFNEGYMDKFKPFYPDLQYIGFRGKVDYYGYDQDEKVIKVIDWKTGKPRSYKMNQYHEQVSQYGYMFYVHGFEFDEVSLYFVDAQEELKINPDIERGEWLIHDKLKNNVNWLQENSFFPKSRSPECKTCKFNLKCYKEDSVALQLWS